MKPIVIANWKMYFGLGEAEAVSRSIERGAEHIHGVEMVLCPALVHLQAVSHELNHVKMGAQNFYPREEGNFTGEVSVRQVAEMCEYVILGHSERRIFLHEKDDMIREKIESALRHHLVPILCVGENNEERKRGKTFQILSTQLKNCLQKIILKEGDHLIVAYEPVWAISGSTNAHAATRADIEKPVAHIKEVLHELFGIHVSQTQIIYGGSTSPENCKDIFETPHVAGALVGTASREPESFLTIAKTLSQLHEERR